MGAWIHHGRAPFTYPQDECYIVAVPFAWDTGSRNSCVTTTGARLSQQFMPAVI